MSASSRHLAALCALAIAAAPACDQGPDATGNPEVTNTDAAAAAAAATPLRPEPAAVYPKPMLPAHPSLAELLDGKADAYDDYKNANGSTYNITAATATPIIAEGEFEPKGGLTVSWTGAFPDVIAGIVANAKPVTTITIIHEGSTAKAGFDNAMAQYGVSVAGLQYLNTQNDSIWIRDFGPIGAMEPNTKRPALIDPRYYHNRVYDDAIPEKLGTQWGLNVFRMPVDFEGGNFMADGRGTCITSQGVLYYNGVNQSALMNYFRDYLGCYQWIILHPLAQEGTTHIDMFSKLVDADTVLLGEYLTSQDATNKGLMDQNADILGAVVLAGGIPLEVVRIPMPGNSGKSTWRTYANSQFINGVNLIPVYTDDTTYQAQALSIWQQVAPEMTHVTLNATQLITWSGAIHCILMEIPAGTWQKYQTDPADICSTFGCYPSSTGGNAGCAGGVPVHGQCSGTTASWCEFGQVMTETCGAGESCGWVPEAGHFGCVSGAACVPSCAGKDCGNDGCGGTCGTCGAGETCNNGVCDASGGCGEVTYEGCCDGNILSYCENNQLVSGSCGTQGCGWDAGGGFYNCGGSGADPSGQNPIACPGECTPSCAGKTCGSDGCGGSCGTCGAGTTCNAAGQCVATCTPSCSGKTCGSDGCGGTCGSCVIGQTCNAAGQCVAGCTPSCAGKNCGSDGCGGSCGTCGAGQTCGAAGVCQANDGCNGVSFEGCCDGNVLSYCNNGTLESGTCQTTCGWDPQNQWYDCGFSGADPSGANPLECPGACTPSCAGKTCGGDGCGGSCGTCGAGTDCNASGQCVAVCTPQCTGKACGSDGCGGSCGTCGAGTTCNAAGQCVANCVPSCTGKACGDDGCGGSCGTCPGSQDCTDAGQCVSVCVPDCAGKSCGGDGCGGLCGSCAAGETCNAGQCVSVCTPDCAGKTCGSDGCGGTCGSCPADQFCVAGSCADECTADCTGKSCGDDGCGGSCGTCGAGEDCDAAGQCVAACVPDCNGKTCGGDGCGGECGSCPTGETCNAAGTCEAGAGCGDVTFEGVCEGAVLTWCEGGALKSYDCGDQGKTCGFVEGTGNTCVNAPCEPSCNGKVCGDDGCGGSCGSCGAGTTCEAGQCVGGGGDCGEVTYEGQCDGDVVTWCDESDTLQTFDCSTQGKVCGLKEGTGYTCIEGAACTPDCSGAACGDDGCGGSCGTCGAGEECSAGQCVPDDGTGGTGGTGNTGGGGADGTGNSGGNVDPGTGSSGSGGSPSGCQGAGGSGAAWWLALAGLAVLRRRRLAR